MHAVEDFDADTDRYLPGTQRAFVLQSAAEAELERRARRNPAGRTSRSRPVDSVGVQLFRPWYDSHTTWPPPGP